MRALLIGIDCYLPNTLPGGVSYPSLGGCVRDIAHVENFLSTTLNVPKTSIRKLTATSGPDGRPLEPARLWPTYENIAAAFREIAESAPGEQVYIHYSGHGGRSPTAYPEIKGPEGLDESLVPTDIGDARARYLRDVEVTYLLKAMIDRGLIVTLVLDCCHSGGATRAARASATARGIDAVDAAKRPDGDVAPRAEIIDAWHAVQGLNRRDAIPAGWPGGKDCVVMAACRPSEVAYEDAFEGEERNGALTYWLLNTLLQSRERITYRQLKDRIVLKVHERFASQNPMLIGPGDRVAFGTELRPQRYSALVTGLEGMDEARLNVGQAHGVRVGAVFAIYPADCTELSNTANRVALGTTSSVGAVESLVRLSEHQPAAVQAGAHAVMVSAEDQRVRCIVGFAPCSIPPKERIDDGVDVAKLETVRRAIEAHGDGWLEVSVSGKGVDYWILTDIDGRYLICDSSGQPMAAASRGEATLEALVQRLVHLAKYRAVQQLENADITSRLRHKLEATVVGTMAQFTPGDTPAPKPFPEGAGASIACGEWAVLRIKNAARTVLNVVVLDLRPDYSIAQIFPADAGNSFWPLDGGESIDLPLRGSLPGDLTSGTDLLKVIGIREATDFHVLELPPLGERVRSRGSSRAAAPGTLAHLLSRLGSERQITRHLSGAGEASQGWTMAQLELEIHAAQAAPNEPAPDASELLV